MKNFAKIQQIAGSGPVPIFLTYEKDMPLLLSGPIGPYGTFEIFIRNAQKEED
jgi:hypothetical protein